MKKRLMLNQKGSSSVLVVLTLLMLVLFGVLGMMSSFSDLKIAQKNADWTIDYYHFETMANILLFDINALSEQKREETQALIGLWKSGKPYNDKLSAASYKKIEEVLKKKSEEVKTFTLVYGVLMSEGLKDYGSDPVIQWSQDVNGQSLLYTSLVTLPSNRRYMVQLDLMPTSGDPYKVLMWREIPETFDYSKGIEFQDVEDIGS